MEEFAVDEVLLERDVIELLKELYLDDRADLGCEEVCELVYIRERGWLPDAVDSCEFHVNAEAAADPSDEVGSIRCDIKGREYDCE